MSELVFGQISEVKVGQVFDSRADLAEAGVHRPTMAGIWGREKEGACSIVLSGGYEDDIDKLDYIYYTGHGGQDAPGGKQISNQEFVRGNKGLQLSCDYSLPVRVTRGHQVENGPPQGYRYDGLYYVTSYERILGKSGFYVCRFHLESESNLSDLEESIKDTLPDDYQVADRTSVTVNRINRKILLREKVKDIYDSSCQVCNIKLLKPNGSIAIGAHINALGQPHNGPDDLSNMLCLCPNHHSQFDAFSFYIDPDTLEVRGLSDYEGKKIALSGKHKINRDFLEYHKKLYDEKNNEV
jgi:putative restriction endonuclease